MFDDWINDAASFISYVETHLGYRPEGMSLDRVKNDEGYFPGNLKWATRKEQNNNRRAPDRTLPTGVTLRREGRFEAQINRDGKNKYLGTFNTAEEASNAFKKASYEYDRT